MNPSMRGSRDLCTVAHKITPPTSKVGKYVCCLCVWLSTEETLHYYFCVFVFMCVCKIKLIYANINFPTNLLRIMNFQVYCEKKNVETAIGQYEGDEVEDEDCSICIANPQTHTYHTYIHLWLSLDKLLRMLAVVRLLPARKPAEQPQRCGRHVAVASCNICIEMKLMRVTWITIKRKICAHFIKAYVYTYVCLYVYACVCVSACWYAHRCIIG